MYTTTSLPSPDSVQLERMVETGKGYTLHMSTCRPAVPCPDCAHYSHRVHSHYDRKLADLPLEGKPVYLRLRTRRFYCGNGACMRGIFTEPLPDFAKRYARRTLGLHQALHLIGLALGGRPGVRLAKQLAMIGARDTILRSVKASAQEDSGEADPVRVLGIDDWAFRKGQRYGTILCDLERHVVLDVLPDRNAETAAAWMRRHPEIEIVSRDRGLIYADAARQGAPQAIQVADRFHLLKNLMETMERVAAARRGELRTLFEGADNTHVSEREAVPSARSLSKKTAARNASQARPLNKAEKSREQSRERKTQRYQEVIALGDKGTPIKAIARRLGLDRRTVRKYLRADSVPESAPRPERRKVLEAHRKYLDEQWILGRRNGAELFRELKSQGYTGTAVTVGNYLRERWAPVQQPGGPRGRPRGPTLPSSRQIAWLLLYPDGSLNRIERREGKELRQTYQKVLEHLGQATSQIAVCAKLGREFIDLVAQRRPNSLDDWINRAKTTACEEFANFATGLLPDYAAVHSALLLETSNGQVEGQVNRLKTLKRQMYGRAGLDLLRARLLASN